MTQVIITLGKDGSVKSEVNGVKGPDCLAKTEFLKKLFGEPADTTLKPSYYETAEETKLDITGLPSGYCG